MKERSGVLTLRQLIHNFPANIIPENNQLIYYN